MEQDYKIETLIKTFSDHAEMNYLHNQQVISVYKEQYPGEEIPPHLFRTFDISKALHAICVEIEKLKTSCD